MPYQIPARSLQRQRLNSEIKPTHASFQQGKHFPHFGRGLPLRREHLHTRPTAKEWKQQIQSQKLRDGMVDVTSPSPLIRPVVCRNDQAWRTRAATDRR